MDVFYAIILGIVQGLTEFLPISSTAHLVITERMFGLSPGTYGLGFNASIQLGTTLAVIWFFRKDLWRLVSRWREPQERNLLLMLVVATIPALIVGYFLKDIVANDLTNLPVIFCTFVIGGIIFLITERIAKVRKTTAQATWKDALIIGLCQVLALIPGTSRSGSTIVPAMLLGLQRAEAARFTFLLSIPVIAAAGFYETLHVAKTGVGGRLDLIAIGGVTAFVVGYFSIKYLIRYLAHHKLNIFAYYRFIVAALILILILH